MIVVYLIGFLVMMFIQAVIINGISISFNGWDEVKPNGQVIYHGNIFYPIARWFKGRPKLEWIGKPIYSCVKCMASVWGAATFWFPVIKFFGYDSFEIYVFICDVFALVYLNFYLYKKV